VLDVAVAATCSVISGCHIEYRTLDGHAVVEDSGLSLAQCRLLISKHVPSSEPPSRQSRNRVAGGLNGYALDRHGLRP